jgi:hypothetical protein
MSLVDRVNVDGSGMIEMVAKANLDLHMQLANRRKDHFRN